MRKKIFLPIIMLCSALSASAQFDYEHFEWGFGVGVANRTLYDMKASSPAMFMVSTSLRNLYFEIGTNFASGTSGDIAKWSEAEGTEVLTDKVFIWSWALGVNFKIKEDKFLITPKFGYTKSSAIYDDPDNDRYFEKKIRRMPHLGISAKYFLTDRTGIAISTSRTCPIMVQILFR